MSVKKKRQTAFISSQIKDYGRSLLPSWIKTTKNKNICPKCGGKIVAEAIGNYGTVYYLRKDGTVGRKLREIKYEHSGDWMYYCQNCGETYQEEDVK